MDVQTDCRGAQRAQGRPCATARWSRRTPAMAGALVAVACAYGGTAWVDTAQRLAFFALHLLLPFVDLLRRGALALALASLGVAVLGHAWRRVGGLFLGRPWRGGGALAGWVIAGSDGGVVPWAFMVHLSALLWYAIALACHKVLLIAVALGA